MANVFYDNFYLKEIKTRALGNFDESNKHYLQIEDNIFHPKGGGQKGDKGIAIVDNVAYVIKDTIKDRYSNSFGVILELEEKLEEMALKDKKVLCKLDWEFRFKQMRLHSAVHLHHCMLEKVMAQKLDPPKTSVIENGFAFNRYDEILFSEDELEKANVEFKNSIIEGAKVLAYPDKVIAGFHWWECLGFKIPCGGTHISDISEIGEVDIKHSVKQGMPNIKITLIN